MKNSAIQDTATPNSQIASVVPDRPPAAQIPAILVNYMLVQASAAKKFSSTRDRNQAAPERNN